MDDIIMIARIIVLATGAILVGRHLYQRHVRPIAGPESGSTWVFFGILMVLAGTFAGVPGAPSHTAAHTAGQTAGVVGMAVILAGLMRILGQQRERVRGGDPDMARALEENQIMFRDVLDHLPLGLNVKDLNSRYRIVNKVFAERYGMTPQDILGKTNEEAFQTWTSSNPIAKEQEVAMIGEGGNQYREEIKTFADGSAHELLISKFPIHDAAGKLRAIGTIGQDLTHIRKTEAELNEQRQILQALVNHSPAAIDLKDLDGRYLMVNAAWAKAAGVDASAALGCTGAEIYGPSHVEESRAQAQHVIETGAADTRERHEVLPDGAAFIRMVTKFPVYDLDHSLLGVGTISTDISEQKKAEAALHDTEMRIRTVINHLPVTLSVKDLDGRYMLINERFADLVNLRADDLLGKTLPQTFNALTENSLSDVRDHERRVVAQRDVIQEERELVYRSGTVTPMHITKFPIFDDAGQVAYIGSIMMDISAQRQRQIERESLIQELETKNAELEAFSYSASHDLKAPLITIGGFIGVLERHLDDPDRQTMADHIGRIRTATEEMMALLNDLYELSRAGRVMDVTKVVSLTEIINASLARIDDRIESRGIAVDVPADLPHVTVDSRRVVQVFQNLLDNAAKFMGDQPAPRIMVRAGRAGDMIEVQVQDNGIGIDPRYRDRVFGLFERLDQRVEGTGIGLSIVKRIVDAHGGSVKIGSSDDGQGTMVVLTLPV